LRYNKKYFAQKGSIMGNDRHPLSSLKDAEHHVISMDYQGEITPLEMSTLPDMISEIEMKYPGCALRIKSLIQELDHATVEIAVDGRGKVDLKQLEWDLKRMKLSQRKQT
jgi:hypothetical protein